MASMAFTTTLSMLQSTSRSAIVRRNPQTLFGISPRSFPVKRRYCAMATRDEASHVAKNGVDAAKKGSQQLKNEAANATDNVAQKTKDIAGKVSETAQGTAGKVKQTAPDAWGNIKDTTQKIKDNVVCKAEAPREIIKDQVAKVEQCMNTKNTTI